MSVAMQQRNSAIVELYNRGIPLTVIGRKFGVTGSRVSQIVTAQGTNGNGNGNGAQTIEESPKDKLIAQLKQEIASLTRLLALAEAL